MSEAPGLARRRALALLPGAALLAVGAGARAGPRDQGIGGPGGGGGGGRR